MLLPRRKYPLVERRNSLDAETVTRDYLGKNRPVVVRTADAAMNAPWELDTLRSAYGEHTAVPRRPPRSTSAVGHGAVYLCPR